MGHAIERYHDISVGHRVVGHEGKCQHLHGHNYRITFVCKPLPTGGDPLDQVGRVIDFGVVKARLCMWLEEHWDHKFLAWTEDELFQEMVEVTDRMAKTATSNMLFGSTVFVPFNPTAENIGEYLVKVVGPQELEGTGVFLSSVKVEETRKCSATYEAE